MRFRGFQFFLKEVFGVFDFIKVLGTGGFATVYMVRKRTTGMLYAMKLVKKDGVKQDEVKFAQVYTER